MPTHSGIIFLIFYTVFGRSGVLVILSAAKAAKNSIHGLFIPRTSVHSSWVLSFIRIERRTCTSARRVCLITN